MTTGSSLHALLGPWTEGLRSRSSHTARSYGACAERFLGHVGAGGPTRASVAEYVASLAGLRAASRAHHISAVRSFVRYARTQGAVPRDPAELLVRPRVAISSMDRYLSDDELRAVLQAAQGLSPRHHAACLLLATTGLRIGEAAHAEWRHLFRDDEGRLGLVVGTGGRERVVKVPERTFRALVALHGGEILDAGDRSPLLRGARRTAYTPNGLWRLVHASVGASGLRKPASPRWLRHSFATLAARGGAPAGTLQASLGHARPETSQRYVERARGLVDQAADYLPELTGDPSRAGGPRPARAGTVQLGRAPEGTSGPGGGILDREGWRVW